MPHLPTSQLVEHPCNSSPKQSPIELIKNDVFEEEVNDDINQERATNGGNKQEKQEMATIDDEPECTINSTKPPTSSLCTNNTDDCNRNNTNNNGLNGEENSINSTLDGTLTTNCYNPALDDEIRSRLDRLNALSDLINSLESQFDHANKVFRETLKCSTDRLSSIAKALGTKSIHHGRLYQAAKLSVEQSQSDCQRACVHFERASNDHRFAKQAIVEAEYNLRKVSGENTNGVISIPSLYIDSIDFCKLKLVDESQPSESRPPENTCDNLSLETALARQQLSPSYNYNNVETTSNSLDQNQQTSVTNEDAVVGQRDNDKVGMALSAAKLSEDLNQALMQLVEAEQKRLESEKQHLDQANKLMIAQENLLRIEREYGPQIKRSQLYFDETKRFNARLNSLKGDISRISQEISSAKQAYAEALNELEQFSEDLHKRRMHIVKA